MNTIAQKIQNNPYKSMCAIFVLWGLGGWVAPSEARADSWSGQDKVMHVAAGAAVGSAVTLMTESKAIGIAAGTIVGLAKEASDAGQDGHTVSAKDAVVTAVGAVLGAYGSDMIVRETSQVWLNFGGVSHHFDRSKKYNERNNGLGLEIRVSPDASLMAGQYKNSVGKTTSYFGGTYQPFHVGNAKFGAAIGVMNGYQRINNGGLFPMAIPMMTYEAGRVGVNVGVIPNIQKHGVDGAVIFQLKIKAF